MGSPPFSPRTTSGAKPSTPLMASSSSSDKQGRSAA
jgi:hypothetical protein